MFAFIRKYVVYFILILFIAVGAGAYLKGKKDGENKITLQNQDNLIDRYNNLFTNIEQEVENFKIQQEIDFESALKRSNERNSLRLEAIERNTRLIELLKEQEQCNINNDLIDVINERLE